MKILFLSSFANPNTGAASIYHLAQKMRGLGHNIRILTTDPTVNDSDFVKTIKINYVERVLNAFFKKIFIQWKYGFYNLNSRNIKKHIDNFDPDIVHVHWIHGHTISLNLISKLSHKYKVFWTFHDMWPITAGSTFESTNDWQDGYTHDKAKRKIWLRKYAILKRSDIYPICPSMWLTLCAKKCPFFDPKHISFIANSIDTDFFSPNPQLRNKLRTQHGLKDNQIAILFFAANIDDPRKGYDHLYNAVELIIKNRPEIMDKIIFFIVGREKNITVKTFNAKHVRISEFLPREEIRNLYLLSDLFVLPTEADNLPSTAVESISSGVPVIAFDVGGVSNIVKNDISGILIGEKDIKGLYEALIRMIVDNNLRNDLSIKSRLFAVENFNEKKQMDSYIECFDKVLKINNQNKDDQRCKICHSHLNRYIDDIFDDRYGYPKSFDVMQCSLCHSLETIPPLREDEVGRLYTQYYPRKNIDPKKVLERGMRWKKRNIITNWISGEHRIHHWLKTNNGNSKPDILDIGCGDGTSLIELHKLGYNAFGTEMDQNIKSVIDTLNLNIYIGNIIDLPFGDKKFDIIIANQVIEHIIDLDQFMQSIKKMLKNEGRVIFSTPNAKSLLRIIEKDKWINFHIPYHQQILSADSVKIIMERNGLSLVKRFSISPQSWIIHGINRLKYKSSIGEVNPYWVDQKPIQHRLYTRILDKLLFIIIFSISKIVDIFGYGDCIIIHGKIKQ